MKNLVLAAIAAFIGMLTFGVYTCIQTPPQTTEELCREWAIERQYACERNAVEEFDGDVEVRAIADCNRTHNITRLVQECSAP